MSKKSKLRKYPQQVYVNDDMTKEEGKVQVVIRKLDKESEIVENLKRFWEELENDVEFQGTIAEADETHAVNIFFCKADESDEEGPNEEIISDHDTDSEME
ncbi:hypothetical protein FQA39_LY06551 [Lamprigera yunnana]|nr:hypothetical protein FQA39_LY06551 [Lamprigera yunnana]